MRSTWSRVEQLDAAECLRLLSSVRLGRLAWSGPAGPQVLPVNHVVVDGTVLFRTDLYGALAGGTRSGTVAFEAFEADELDDRLRSGWSVLVVGRAGHVRDHDELLTLFGRVGEPWVPGPRPLVARIVPSEVTGRRFLKD